MKKIVLLAIVVVTLLALYVISTPKKNLDTVTVANNTQAIALLKEKYPEYQSYPSDNLPIKRIEAMTTSDGWRVGMYIGGSGLPGILSAHCFLVTKSGIITDVGFFNGEGPAKSINLTTCTPKD